MGRYQVLLGWIVQRSVVISNIMQATCHVKFSSSCIKTGKFILIICLTWNIQNIVILTCNQYKIISEIFYILPFLLSLLNLLCISHLHHLFKFRIATFRRSLTMCSWLVATELTEQIQRISINQRKLNQTRPGHTFYRSIETWE